MTRTAKPTTAATDNNRNQYKQIICGTGVIIQVLLSFISEKYTQKAKYKKKENKILIFEKNMTSLNH